MTIYKQIKKLKTHRHTLINKIKPLRELLTHHRAGLKGAHPRIRPQILDDIKDTSTKIEVLNIKIKRVDCSVNELLDQDYRAV
ncbi:MAG: hypothetical protein GY941_27910 [Planctomycetes bacterium]|nr:hypothetical protein [Planctomycetota bacterium]